MYLGSNSRCVDVGNASIEITHGDKSLVHIASVKRRGQAVFNVVRNEDGVVKTLTWNNGDHGTEDFFLRDAHFGINIAENGWLHEKSVLIIALVQPIAAAYQLCTLSFADFDIFQIVQQ